MIARPIMTRPMPHQRRIEIVSPRIIQQPNGTRTSTTLERGKAIVSGTYRRTYSQLRKLMITKKIAHQTSGDASPVIPVQDQALVRFAVSDAPCFSSNSEASTQTTLRASWNQGFANPEGRSRNALAESGGSTLIGIGKSPQNRVVA